LKLPEEQPKIQQTIKLRHSNGDLTFNLPLATITRADDGRHRQRAVKGKVLDDEVSDDSDDDDVIWEGQEI